jgi:hypothetical protein
MHLRLERQFYFRGSLWEIQPRNNGEVARNVPEDQEIIDQQLRDDQQLSLHAISWSCYSRM